MEDILFLVVIATQLTADDTHSTTILLLTTSEGIQLTDILSAVTRSTCTQKDTRKIDTQKDTQFEAVGDDTRLDRGGSQAAILNDSIRTDTQGLTIGDGTRSVGTRSV